MREANLSRSSLPAPALVPRPSTLASQEEEEEKQEDEEEEEDAEGQKEEEEEWLSAVRAPGRPPLR